MKIVNAKEGSRLVKSEKWYLSGTYPNLKVREEAEEDEIGDDEFNRTENRSVVP